MKREFAYPAVFKPEENGGYFIEFPDIQGAYTGINENNKVLGLSMAKEVLSMVLADYIENGYTLPMATDIDDLEIEPDALATLVKVTAIG